MDGGRLQWSIIPIRRALSVITNSPRRALPLGKIFAKLDLDSGSSWTATLSHELLEMLADPWINWCAVGSDSKIYALEVCDAVEADNLGYFIDNVLVSDFVTPAWFEPTCADRMDFKQHFTKELEVARGGYISIFNAADGMDADHGKGRRRRAAHSAREPQAEKKTDSAIMEKKLSVETLLGCVSDVASNVSTTVNRKHSRSAGIRGGPTALLLLWIAIPSSCASSTCVRISLKCGPGE